MLTVKQSAQLLKKIFPNYPNLAPCNPLPANWRAALEMAEKVKQ